MDSTPSLSASTLDYILRLLGTAKYTLSYLLPARALESG